MAQKQTPLAWSGDVDKVRKLLKGGKYDVSCVNCIEQTPLHLAAAKGHLNVVRVLISEFKADVNGMGNGDTPLHWAASGGHLDVVRVLISEFLADPNTRDGNGDTPLHVAAAKGHLGVVSVLISEFKVDVNTHTDSGETPLHWAANNGHLDMVRVLISEFKADVSAQTCSGSTPVHLAAYWGYLNVVRVLISEFNADINAHDNHGDAPLHLAAANGNLDVVRMLISEFKAGVDTRTDNGNTPLHLAANNGHLDMVRVLISEFRADFNACTNSGETPIDMAIAYSRKEVALALINEFHCDTKGGTPYIHTACKRGWVKLVRALVQKHGTGILKDSASADVTADNKGNTPLHVAAMCGREDVVLCLVNEFCCDVTVTGHLGRSLLHSACASYNASLVRHVSRYISPWVVDDNGDTPLHICARLGRKGCVQALLKLAPPVMVRNNLGQTPKDLEETRKATFGYNDASINAYIKKKKQRIYSQYEVVQKHAKKKYSLPEPITRAFVVGNTGAGKSSLVEALKREGFVDSFKRVSESSVPPHCWYSPKHPHQQAIWQGLVLRLCRRC